MDAAVSRFSWNGGFCDTAKKEYTANAVVTCMTTKEKVLAALEAQRGSFLSGEALSAELTVSRAAVWKAIKSLQQAGVPIRAVSNRGYCLDADADTLSVAGVADALPAGLPYQIQTEVSVSSTNLSVRALAEAGSPEGTVLLAERQTAGRGRLGRQFHSPDGGLYCSILLRPPFPATESLFITTAAAVAVAEAVEALAGESVQIKWVNDLFLHGKKICGILTEASLDIESGRLAYAVLGIGINLKQPTGGFSPELRDIAGAVFPADARQPALRCRMAAEVLTRFWRYYQEIGSRSFLEGYRSRSLLTEQPILVLRGNTTRPAIARSITEDCRLLVTYEDGTEEALSSGEVQIRRQTNA